MVSPEAHMVYSQSYLTSHLLVEDFALRITSDDKVVKQGFVTVMVLSAQVLNLWNPFSWGGRRGGGR